MGKELLKLYWAKTPDSVKRIVLAIAVYIYALNALDNRIDQRAHAAISPFKAKQEVIQEAIVEIKTDLRDLRNALIGPPPSRK